MRPRALDAYPRCAWSGSLSRCERRGGARNGVGVIHCDALAAGGREAATLSAASHRLAGLGSEWGERVDVRWLVQRLQRVSVRAAMRPPAGDVQAASGTLSARSSVSTAAVLTALHRVWTGVAQGRVDAQTTLQFAMQTVATTTTATAEWERRQTKTNQKKERNTNRRAQRPFGPQEKS